MTFQSSSEAIHSEHVMEQLLHGVRFEAITATLIKCQQHTHTVSTAYTHTENPEPTDVIYLQPVLCHEFTTAVYSEIAPQRAHSYSLLNACSMLSQSAARLAVKKRGNGENKMRQQFLNESCSSCCCVHVTLHKQKSTKPYLAF